MSDAPQPDNQSSSTFTISISRRSILTILAIIIAIWLALHLVNVMIVIFSAILISAAIHQPVSWIERRGIPRQAAVLAVYLMLVGILTGLVLLLIPLVTTEISTVQDKLPDYANQLELEMRKVAPEKDFQFDFSDISNQLGDNLNTIALRLTDVSLATGHVLILLFITLIISYYLTVQPDLVPRAFARFFPGRQHERIFAIDRAVRYRIGGWARGQALVAVSFGIGMGIGLWLLGIPYALSLGVIAAVLEVIPYLGGIVTLLLALPLALTVDLPHAIAVLILYIILSQIEAHIVSPYFLGRAVELPPVVVLIALLTGAEVGGIIGILLAVPVAIVAWGIIEEIWPPATP